MCTADFSPVERNAFLPCLLAVTLRAGCAALALPVYAAATSAVAFAATTATATSTLNTVKTVSATPVNGQADTITVVAAPDNTFRAGGDQLVPAFLDGQIANGGRLGFLGQQDANNVPFSIVGFTSKLIQDQQARSLADVLNNDASVQSGYGYGNYAQTFVVRGFSLDGDDISYGGLYGILPRQMLPTEFAERIELLKGSSAFLNGVPPGGTGVGGTVNVEPKRAGDEPLNRVSLDYTSTSQEGGAFDLSRRYGDNNQFGVRINGAHREGGTAIDDERRRMTMGSVGLDYRGDRFRSSLDVGVVKQTVHGGRPVVYLGTATKIPEAPSATSNYGQPWAFTDTENEFGMLRAEYDLTDAWTTYGAVGANHTHEYGKYASPTLSGDDGDATMSRMTVPYFSDSLSSQAGVRGKFSTGFVKHNVNLGMSTLYSRTRSAYTLTGTTISENIYHPVNVSEPMTDLYSGGDMGDPGVTNRVRNYGVALSDTLSILDDRLQFTGGLRRQNVVVYNYDYTGAQSSSFDQTKVTPAFGLVVKPWDHISLYANHIEALQAGETAGTQYNGVLVSNGGQVSGIETSKQNEVGIKADYGRVAGSLALFEIKKPVGVYTPSSNGYVFGNNGEVRNRGLELNVFGEPLFGVRINGSMAWMDPQLTKTQDGTYNGNDAVGVPRYQMVVGGEWDLPGLTGLTATGKVIHTGSQYADQANQLKVDDWTRLDLGVRYNMNLPRNTIIWRAAIENVTNEKYWASATGGYLTQGDPREAKVSMTVDF
ncbi:TonB-dependent siderophore receptor [Acerihabitans sp. TG2]|uniref:TonB-dependent receptor n=1 Tax=Acerihabitans sp. TG2 TaxID=3096008 RepID=UPI002B224B1F|nr:TonB-dependent siderophore receptor [Acerihabitans sp. TG2]MEA9392884.1 TonB-dependent siderophore receptor [Acerihabitans sp. TG2]